MHIAISKSMQLTRSNVYKEANKSHPVRNYISGSQDLPWQGSILHRCTECPGAGMGSSGTFPAQRSLELVVSGVPQALSKSLSSFSTDTLVITNVFILISSSIDDHLGIIQPNCTVRTKISVCIFPMK